MCAIKQSRFVAEFLPGLNLHGSDVIAFVVKRAYALNAFEGRLDVLDEQPEIRAQDEFYEDEAELLTPSVRNEAELFVDKQGADVVFLGSAHAPKGKPTPSFDCSLRIGRRVRQLRIFGPRTCVYQPPRKAPKPDKETGRIDESLLPPPEFSEPASVSEVALRLSNAYGGESLVVPWDPEAFEALETETEKPAEQDEANDADPFSEGGTRQVDIAALDVPDLEAYGRSAESDRDAEGTRVLREGAKVVEDGDWEGRMREGFGDKGRDNAPVEHDSPDWPKVSCPQNPIGKGFALGNHAETIDGLVLPLVEDPDRPLRPEDIPRSLETLLDNEDAIVPAGFGWLPRYWWPRATLNGVNPKELKEAQLAVDKQVAALDPDDAEERARAEQLIDFEVPVVKPDFYRGAPPSLRFDALVGDEDVELTNLSADGGVFFRLPGDHPVVTLERGAGPETIDVRLDTVTIDGERSEVELVWRGVLPFGGADEFSTYPRFDVSLQDGGAEEARARREEAALLRKQADGDVDDRQEDTPRTRDVERDYRDSLRARPSEHDREVERDQGTRVLRAGEHREEADDSKVVSDENFAGWVDRESADDENSFEDEAAEVRAKKAALRKRLIEQKKENTEEDE